MADIKNVKSIKLLNFGVECLYTNFWVAVYKSDENIKKF